MEILNLLIEIFTWGLIFYCILSFVRTPDALKAYDFLGKIYRPFLEPISNLLAPIQKNSPGLDFSPIVLILILNMVQRGFGF